MKRLLTIIIVFFLFNKCYSQTTNISPKTDTAYSFDNVPIVYQKTGNGKEVLVFIHCWSCDKSYWANQVEYFGKYFTVIALDLASHGESGSGRKDWTIENYGKDVKSVVEKENLSDVILIGHSMGGAVVLSAAQLLGSKVKALIGIDTFQDIEFKYSDEELKEFLVSLEKDFSVKTKEFVKGMFPESADSNLVEMISNDMSSAPPEVAVASLKDLFNFEEAKSFEKIDIPVRFLNADKYPTNIESAKRHIKDFDLKIVADTGHFLMLEKPEEFNKKLEEIINKLKN